MDTIVTIRVFGEVYKFKAGADVFDAQRIADFLMQEVEHIEEKLGPQSLRTITKPAKLLLASVSIANAYLDLKEEYESTVSELEERSAALLDSFEDILAVLSAEN